MRWTVLLSSVVSVLLLVPARAHAQSFGAATLGVEVGTATRQLLQTVIPEPVAGAYPTPPSPELRVELSDWVDPSSHSTARVGRACEQRYVAYLTGTRGLNYLEFKLFNDSESEVVVDARSRVFERTFRTHARTRHGFRKLPVRIAAHSGQLLLLELEKRLFYRLREFDFVFDLSFADGRRCQLKVEFARKLPAAPATFKTLSRYDMGVSAGPYLTSGSLRDTVGPVGSTTTLSLSWYPAVQHGVRLEFGVDSLGGYRFAGGWRLVSGYEYRIFLTPRVSYSVGIGAGAYLFTANPDDPASSARWALLVRESMQWKFDLPVFSAMDMALAPTLTFGVLPGGRLGATEVTGALYTGALELIIGM